MMDSFIELCVHRSRVIIMLLILIFISGVYAYVKIPKERNPDVQIPIIYVVMTHEGISPEDAERLLVRPMETELRTIEGIKQMTSRASEGSASVTLEFHAGLEIEKALQDVREKVDIAKAELPADTDEPTVNEVNLSLFPVLNVTINGNVPERTLISIARKLRDNIEAIPNILNVEIAGDREDAVEIIIDPLAVEGYGITLDAIKRSSEGFNKLIAAGAINTKGGRYNIKVPGLLENLNDILQLPIKVNGNAVVTVGDVAKIKKTFKDAAGYARTNGEPSIVLEVSKRTGTNIIETVKQVRAVVGQFQKSLPPHVKITYSQDISSKILEMLSDLQNNIILAIILVMAVIIAVIGWRSATLITIAIPGAFLMGVMFLYLTGLTMNVVVLFSLILSIGMLVDSAIVICEMADRKMMEKVPHWRAYLEASKYMKWPIIASTATTLVVFMPLLFWPGIVGQFMQYMPVTLIATLSASMVMAIIFIPTLGAIFGRPANISQKAQEDLICAESGDLNKLTGIVGWYYRALKAVISRAKLFALSIFATLFAVYIYYGFFGTGVEFFPNMEPEQIVAQVRARGNLSVEEKDKILKEVEQRIYGMKDEIRVIYGRSGAAKGSSKNQISAADTIGSIQMEYVDWDKRRKSEKIIEEIRQRTKDIPGIMLDISAPEAGPKSNKPIELEIGSHYPQILPGAVERILNIMDEIGGFVDIEDSRPVPAIEWKMQLNRELAARFGVDVNMVGSFIKLVTNGLRVTSYRPDDSEDEVDIIARFPQEYRNINMLDTLRVVTQDGSVPISYFVERKARPQLSSIERSDGYRVIKIKSNIQKDKQVYLQLAELKKKLYEEEFDPNIIINFKGDQENQKESGDFLRNAFILALFFMALILVAQFNSIYAMFIILSAVLLSTVGVLIGLIVTNQPFGIVMCGVGIISLSGIVVNNNIIFIDTYQKLLKTGMEPIEAILRTGMQRIRPILLTAGTTVLGLLPMVFGMNIDFIDMNITFGAPSGQWWKQLSTTIAGGLTFATILTLFFTPSLLVIGSNFRRK
ncbi:efflux RND transporter permease subunit [Rickettsiales bacterium]|nr:efflux RND transporter permease subunit [Rickettsiales bacterium]